MPLPRLGLRLRIALTLALVCLLVMGMLGVTIYTASENLENALLHQLSAEEMDYLVERHRQDPGFVPQPAAGFQSYIVRSPEDYERVPAHLRELAVGHHDVYVGKEEFEVLVREGDGVRYYVAYELGPYEQREQAFKILVLIAVLTAALVSLALGYWLSGMLVSQVTALARQVGSLKPGQPRGTLARSDQDPEVALLARAFDDYQARIEQMIQREQEFTANASHELRTPLTAIRTSCELLLTETSLPGKIRARIEMMDAAAARMAEQIQVLLFLAREQAVSATEPVSIRECVNEATETYRQEMARKGVAFDVQVEPEATLNLNRQALSAVLGNLVRNAAQYTEQGFVRVTYHARRLTVADSGRGIGSEDQSRLFERFYRAAPGRGGFGLGLAIVKRICDTYGWTVEVSSTPGRGSVFCITFP